jgi:hypothetical protein
VPLFYHLLHLLSLLYLFIIQKKSRRSTKRTSGFQILIS